MKSVKSYFRKNYRKITLVIIFNLIFSQEYKIQFSHIPIGQGVGESDSIIVSNSIGAILSNDMSSDSFAIGTGFLKTAQNAFSEPPVISNFNLPEFIQKTGQSVSVMAILYDLNGISSADLYLQKGASSNEIIIPMFTGDNGEYIATIADSLIGVENFRARIVGMDNVGFSSSTDYQSTQIQFNSGELTMSNHYSNYPMGVKSNQWKLISWPGLPKDIGLAQSELEDGHVFYTWDPVKKKYSIAEEIKLGHSYWFRHIYNEPVIFEEDSSVAISLQDFTIDLDRGWNLIGSPFSFPVAFNKDSVVSDPITFSDAGWTDSQSELVPWNGYAVYTGHQAEITLKPFDDEGSSSDRIAYREEWYLNLKLESSNYINYSPEIGRRKYAENAYDIFDIPIFPDVDSRLSLVMDLNGSKPFEYMKDIRDIDDENGVWNLKLDAHQEEKTIFIHSSLKGAIPEELSVAIIDIPERKIVYDFLDKGITISKDSEVAYDMKLVAGDGEYVFRMAEEILASIPLTFSLSQNYPNPFNPITRMNYTLPERSKVIISVYNVLGQEVKTLLNKEQEYGFHSVSWNGINNQGKQMSSGVYFARMTCKQFSQTKKMLLVK